jgi:hypothetical protein
VKYRISRVSMDGKTDIIAQVEAKSMDRVVEFVKAQYIPEIFGIEAKVYAKDRWMDIRVPEVPNMGKIEIIQVAQFILEKPEIQPLILGLPQSTSEVLKSFMVEKIQAGSKLDPKDIPAPSFQGLKPNPMVAPSKKFTYSISDNDPHKPTVDNSESPTSKVHKEVKELWESKVVEKLEDGDHTKVESKLDSHYDEICKAWGINPNLRLVEWCSNFYTLYYLILDHPEVKEKFEEYKELLLVQFQNYIDMACGGELRHSKGRATGTSKIKGLSKQHDQILSRVQKSGDNGRVGAWQEWRLIRDEYGLQALQVAEDCFTKMGWSGAYGGKKWGTAAQILRFYLEDNITATTFIDTVWSLQHNCNYILDKVWKVPSELKFILDCKVEDKIAPITKYCTKEVKELWESKASEADKAGKAIP